MHAKNLGRVRRGRTLLAAWLICMVPLSAVGASNQGQSWQQILHERLPLYGHRNWIVIADSAYPAQSRAAIETIVADTDQLTVLKQVLEELSHSRHVSPIPYTDTELNFLSNNDVPGIDSVRRQILKLLPNPVSIPHEQIISKLDQAAQLFQILIIKTNSTLPYTTVFLQLDCAYWKADSEKKLRARMAAQTK